MCEHRTFTGESIAVVLSLVVPGQHHDQPLQMLQEMSSQLPTNNMSGDDPEARAHRQM